MRTLFFMFLGLLTLSTKAIAASDETISIKPVAKPVKAGVPFLFSSNDWGLAYGAAGVISGVGQPQMTLFGTVIGSTNNNLLGFAGLYNVIVPGWDQIQFDFSILEADYQQSTYFVAGHPDYLNEQPGSNHSSYENAITTSAREQYYRMHIRYNLPVGTGKDGALLSAFKKYQTYEQAGYEWNPMISGITTLELQPFYHQVNMTRYKPAGEAEQAIGLRFMLEYDNRNASQLPTRGSLTSITYTRDRGSDDRADWATVELNFSKFFDLGSNDYFNQQVIAFNGWLADTPTWNDTTTVNGQTAYRRPPFFAGITLGDWDQLRGYSTGRYYGRSAVSYSLEYRVMPWWQPMQDMPLLGPVYDMPWWQWALFVDIGRVSDRFDFKELHTQMKASAGAGLRFQVEGITVRTEIAAGTEDWFWRVFINQPF